MSHIAFDYYRGLYKEYRDILSGSEHSWLQEIRDEGLNTFLTLGFPGRKVEDWKYTPMTHLDSVEFTVPLKKPVSKAELPHQTTHAHFLVFVDGYFQASLSKIGDLPKGVVLTSLADAITSHPDEVKANLNKTVDFEKQPFASLNNAFMSDGLFLKVPKGVEISDPIELLFLEDAEKSQDMIHYRHLILADANSNATIVEHYVGTDAQSHFTNVVSEFVLMEGAMLSHYKIQSENSHGVHVGGQHVSQDRNSNIKFFTFTLGSKLSRNDIHIGLTEEGAECELNGFYMVDKDQHTDTHARVDHFKPHGQSTILFKGIAGDKAKGVYNGKVIVHEDAQKCLSSQSNKNLLLSNLAEINTKPELEIYADDVKCAHGATVGEMDKDSLFYLRSRGIPEEDARELLVKAFVEEVLDKVELIHLRNHLSAMMVAKLNSAGGSSVI